MFKRLFGKSNKVSVRQSIQQADILFAQGDFWGVIACIDYAFAINESIRLDPNIAGVYHARGIAHFNVGAYDKAIADYNQVIILDRPHAIAYYNRGNAYFHIDEHDRALADCNRTVIVRYRLAIIA